MADFAQSTRALPCGMPHDHDAGYKWLFAAPEMMRDLLLGFVGHDWVKSADFASLQRVNASYVGDDLRSRHDDMVWKIRLRDEWFYVYLLLEFQSASDPWMALRMHVYVGLLYQDLVARREIGPGDRLPAVLPIVLYNGQAPWRAPLALDALLLAHGDRAPAGLALGRGTSAPAARLRDLAEPSIAAPNARS